jgi:2-polyprenyl-3-methyl-5-hydroxy-6-metoxy-1,4-benzoquinol methylase
MANMQMIRIEEYQKQFQNKLSECRVCNSKEIRRYGSTLCQQAQVALDHCTKRFLYKCDNCRSVSVEPIPSLEELSLYYDCYATIEKSKQSLSKRKSLSIIHQLTKSLGHGKVLDIGCGFGDILASLPSSFQKVGLDMASDACKEAEKKGVEAICSSWESFNSNDEFDLVIALDFLEHVDDVSSSLNKISKVLRSGGYVVIETGNADSWAAKTLGEDWCYPAVFGHLQVLSPCALVDLATNAQIYPISIIKENHSSKPFDYILYRGILAYGFHLMKLASSLLQPAIGDFRLIQKLFQRNPPGAILWDHMIMIGRKECKNHNF